MATSLDHRVKLPIEVAGCICRHTSGMTNAVRDNLILNSYIKYLIAFAEIIPKKMHCAFFTESFISSFSCYLSKTVLMDLNRGVM